MKAFIIFVSGIFQLRDQLKRVRNNRMVSKDIQDFLTTNSKVLNAKLPN